MTAVIEGCCDRRSASQQGRRCAGAFARRKLTARVASPSRSSIRPRPALRIGCSEPASHPGWLCSCREHSWRSPGSSRRLMPCPPRAIDPVTLLGILPLPAIHLLNWRAPRRVQRGPLMGCFGYSPACGGALSPLCRPRSSVIADDARPELAAAATVRHCPRLIPEPSARHRSRRRQRRRAVPRLYCPQCRQPATCA